MAIEDSTSCQRIVVGGLAAGKPGSKPVITLLDESGRTLETAIIEDDGSCELSKEALASAAWTIVAPICVGVQAGIFRELISPEGCFDMGALLCGPVDGQDEQPPGGPGYPLLAFCRHQPQGPPPW